MVESGGNLFKNGRHLHRPKQHDLTAAITFVVIGHNPHSGFRPQKNATSKPRSRFCDLNFAETAINWNLILDVDFFFLSAGKGEQLNDEIKSCQIVTIHR